MHQIFTSTDETLIKALAQELTDEFHMATDFGLVAIPPQDQPHTNAETSRYWSIEIQESAKNYEASLRELVSHARSFTRGWHARLYADLWKSHPPFAAQSQPQTQDQIP